MYHIQYTVGSIYCIQYHIYTNTQTITSHPQHISYIRMRTYMTCVPGGQVGADVEGQGHVLQPLWIPRHDGTIVHMQELHETRQDRRATQIRRTVRQTLADDLARPRRQHTRVLAEVMQRRLLLLGDAKGRHEGRDVAGPIVPRRDIDPPHHATRQRTSTRHTNTHHTCQHTTHTEHIQMHID